MTLKLAVVGAGWAGTRQVEAALTLDGVEVVAIVDSDTVRAAELAGKAGISRSGTDLNAILTDPDVDAVSICSPHRFHHSQAIAALRSGKHVLCEKPMALSVAEATDMVATADEQGSALYVAESEVYRNLTIELRRRVRSGVIGTLSAVSIARGFSAMDFSYPDHRSWLTDPASGGTGTWMLHGIHTVAQLRSVFGDIARVLLWESRTPGFRREGIEATVSGVLVTADGLPITLIQTSESPINTLGVTHRVYGVEGVIEANAERITVLRPGRDPEIEYLDPDGIDPYVREIRAFIDHVSTGDGPTAGSSELATVQTVDAGYRSIATGGWVEVTGSTTD